MTERTAPTTAGLDPDAYLRRIGVDPDGVRRADLAALERLQRAHVTSVPFENLAIVGDPHGEAAGEGVELSVPHLYGKVVERELGGYCFELNGLFYWLLSELGYDVDRVAGCVPDGDEIGPANHHANVVDLERRYLVEVGTGTPMVRQPVPLGGGPLTDEVGITWRVVPSDRPAYPLRLEYRDPEGDGWTTRYVFGEEPRGLSYFAATNDFLGAARSSPFTGSPVVAIATPRGHRKLSGDTLTETTAEADRERTVPAGEWHATLERGFGLAYDHW